MAYQSQSQGLVAFKAQSAKGTVATGASGFVLRITGGGLQYNKGVYGSNEVRRDLMRSRGRHGLKSVTGTYTCELSLDMIDAFLEALFRTTATTALTVTEATASLASIVTDSAGTITAGGGSWITAGFRVGDVVRLTGHSSAGNNSRNLLITALTATVMTVTCLDGGALTTNAVADTAFTIIRPGLSLINPSAPAAPVYFTVEEWDGDLDLARAFHDCRVHMVKFNMAPGGLVTVDITFTGTGLFSTASGGSAPTLTSPTASTGVPLSAVDAVVRLGSSVRAELTSFDLTLDIGAVAPEVVAATISPDVFTGAMSVSMNLSMLMTDYTELTAFAAETAYSLSTTFSESETAPADFMSIFVPNFTLGGFEASPLSREAGPRTVTVPVPADLVGIDSTGGAYDSTMCKIIVSNT